MKSKKVSPRQRHLQNKFGITEDQYNEILSKQHGCCAVCGRAAESFRYRLAVDHDHKSSEIRGLLCINCNRYVVGRHRRDCGADLLRRAYEYLIKEYPGWLVPKRKKKRRGRKKIRAILQKQK